LFCFVRWAFFVLVGEEKRGGEEDSASKAHSSSRAGSSREDDAKSIRYKVYKK
jgi:hypothetical protein